MSNRKSSDYQRARRFLATVDQLLADLPSESEKKRMAESLVAVAEFLETLRQTVSGLPSTDDVAAVRSSVRQLDEAIARAEANPLVGGVFRGPATVRKRLKPVALGARDLSEAEARVNELEALSVDEMRARLGKEDAYSMQHLRALARVLGIRNATKLSREVLMHQISARVANYRGYRRLGGDQNPQSHAEGESAGES